MRSVLWIVVIAGGLFLLDRLLRWMERRGWIYYRIRRGSAGTALGPVLDVFHPTREYTVVEQQRQRVVRVESQNGEDEQPGAGETTGFDDDPQRPPAKLKDLRLRNCKARA